VIRFVTLALSLSISAAALADGGLDLLVMLDCSRSMARHPRGEVLLLRMTADMLIRNASANRLEHRLAVIRFGSEATVDLPFTPVLQLGRRLDGIGYEDRGETDVLKAFMTAEQLFRSLPTRPERRRAIVLFTDGVAYVRNREPRAYRAGLERFIARSGIPIDVLLTDAREEAFWRDPARVELAGRTPDQWLASAHGVIARLAGTQTAESTRAKTRPTVDTLFVPPYLDLIVFDVFRPSPGVTVDVFPPGSAEPIRAGGNGVESVSHGAVLTSLTVSRPVAGEWTIRKSHGDGGVRILSQQFFPRGALLRPGQRESPRQCDRVPLLYRIHDGSGQAFEELPNHPLALQVTLAKPGGATEAIAMERHPSAGTGGFRSVQDVACDLPGRYWTDVRITTRDANGYRLDVFRDRWSGFSVSAAGSSDCSERRAEARLGALPVAAQAIGAGGIALLLLAAMTALAAFVSFRKTKS